VNKEVRITTEWTSNLISLGLQVILKFIPFTMSVTTSIIALHIAITTSVMIDMSRV